MNIIKTYFLDVITKNYVNFKGRATRQQFWMFVLFYLIIYLILTMLSLMDNMLGSFFWLLQLFYSLGMILPGLAIGVRRLHDTNRCGWWWFITFLPLIGNLILFIFWVLPSTPGQNRFDAQA